MPQKTKIKEFLQDMNMAARGGDFILLDDCISKVCDEFNSLANSAQWLMLSDAISSLTKVQQYQEDIPDEAILHIAKKIPFSIRGIATMTDRCDEVQIELANNLVRFQGYDTLTASHIKHTINSWIARGNEQSAVQVMADILSSQTDEDNNVDLFIVACKAASLYKRSFVMDFLKNNDHQIASLRGHTKEASISDAVNFYKFGMKAFANRLFYRKNQTLMVLDLYKIHETTGKEPLSRLVKDAWIDSSICGNRCAVAYTIAVENVAFPQNFNKNPKLPNAIQNAIQTLDEEKIKYSPARAAKIIDHLLQDFDKSALRILSGIPQNILLRSDLMKRDLISSDFEI